MVERWWLQGEEIGLDWALWGKATVVGVAAAACSEIWRTVDAARPDVEPATTTTFWWTTRSWLYCRGSFTFLSAYSVLKSNCFNSALMSSTFFLVIPGTRSGILSLLESPWLSDRSKRLSSELNLPKCRDGFERGVKPALKSSVSTLARSVEEMVCEAPIVPPSSSSNLLLISSSSWMSCCATIRLSSSK